VNNPRSALWTTGLCVPLISIGIPKKVPSPRLVELPRQPFGDGRLYASEPGGRSSGQRAAAMARLFNHLYAESAIAPMFTTFQLHPYVSSRLGRTSALKEMIEYMKGHGGVWFATGVD
jgi:hypothetical protein